MEKPIIVIAEGDEILCQNSKRQLSLQGFEIVEACEPAKLLQTIQTRSPDLVILGSCVKNDWDAVRMARAIHEWDREIPLIMIVAESSEDLAIAAIRAGVSDYLKKPISADELFACVNKCLSEKPCSRRPPAGKTTECNLVKCEGLIGESPAITLIKTYISKVAATESIVLITGETGTGKELVAELIHKNSVRSKKPFVCVNCAALPDSLLESELFGYERGAFTGATVSQRGKFELADSGTIFLDEIGDMSLRAQAKILRTIENKEVYRLGGNRGLSLNLRIIAATNHDPERLVKENHFREDLYYRLNVARVHLPPLRDRKEDILCLLDHFIRDLNSRSGRSVEGFTDEVLACLLHYKWPGNVRELKNLCEAIFISMPSRTITIEDLPALYQSRLKELELLPQNERDRLLSALLATNWNVSKAAEKLHWSRMTIYRKLEKYHIKRNALDEKQWDAEKTRATSAKPM